MGLAFTKRGVVFTDAKDFEAWHLPDVRAAFARWQKARKPQEPSGQPDPRFLPGRRHFQHLVPRRVFFEVFDNFQSHDTYLSLLHKFAMFDNTGTGAANVYEAFIALILCCKSPMPSKVDLFFHVFAGQVAEDQQRVGDVRAISAQDMSFILHTMADTVWKLRGADPELRIPAAAIDTLAVEMFYLADSDMNGVVEWNEFEIWGNSQLKSKSLINRITPLPKQPDVSALSALAVFKRIGKRRSQRRLGKQNSSKSLKSVKSEASDASAKAAPSAALVGTVGAMLGGFRRKKGLVHRGSVDSVRSDGSELGYISEESGLTEGTSPVPFEKALSEIDEKKLRAAIRAEERHLKQKRLKRVETMTTGVPYNGEDGESTSSEIEEELHEHALGSSDSSGSDHGSVYGRRGQVMAGAKLMKDPLLRHGASKHRGWNKKVSKSKRHLRRHGSSGRRLQMMKRRHRAESEASKAANGNAMAHQLLMLEASDNNSDEEEAGGDAFNASMGMGGLSVTRMLKSGARSTIFEGEHGEETRLSGNMQDPDGDSDAVAEALHRRNRRQSTVAQARRRLSMHLSVNGLAAQVGMLTGMAAALPSPGNRSHRSFNSPHNSPARGLSGNVTFFGGDSVGGTGPGARRRSVRGSGGSSRRASVRIAGQASPPQVMTAAQQSVRPRPVHTTRRGSNVFHTTGGGTGSGGATSKHTHSGGASAKHGSGNTSTSSLRKSSRRPTVTVAAKNAVPTAIDKRRRSVARGKAVVEEAKEAMKQPWAAQQLSVVTEASAPFDAGKRSLRTLLRTAVAHGGVSPTRFAKQTNQIVRGDDGKLATKGVPKMMFGDVADRAVSQASFFTPKLKKMRKHTHDMKIRAITSRSYLASTAKATHFTKNEIVRMAPYFAVVSEVTGELSREAFIAIIRDHMPAFADWEPRLVWLFSTMDDDGNGSVSFREFCTGLSAILRGDMYEKLDMLFRIHDLDHDGSISVRELIHLVTTGNSELEDLLNRADAIVSSLDCDNDNEISSAEFIASLHQRPELMDNFSQTTNVSVEMAATIRQLHQLQPEFCAARLRSVPKRFAGHMHLLTQKVNKAGFHDFMRKSFDCEEDVHPQLDAMFETMDSLKVGYLVIRVLLNNFAQMLCRTVQEQTEFYFALYDIDGSGTLDSNEIVFMLLSTQMSANPAAAAVLDMIHHMDESCTGFVRREEFRLRAVRSQLVMDTMSRLFAVPLATQLNPEALFAPRPKLTKLELIKAKGSANYQASPRLMALYQGRALPGTKAAASATPNHAGGPSQMQSMEQAGSNLLAAKRAAVVTKTAAQQLHEHNEEEKAARRAKRAASKARLAQLAAPVTHGENNTWDNNEKGAGTARTHAAPPKLPKRRKRPKVVTAAPGGTSPTSRVVPSSVHKRSARAYVARRYNGSAMRFGRRVAPAPAEGTPTNQQARKGRRSRNRSRAGRSGEGSRKRSPAPGDGSKTPPGGRPEIGSGSDGEPAAANDRRRKARAARRKRTVKRRNDAARASRRERQRRVSAAASRKAAKAGASGASGGDSDSSGRLASASSAGGQGSSGSSTVGTYASHAVPSDDSSDNGSPSYTVPPVLPILSLQGGNARRAAKKRTARSTVSTKARPDAAGPATQATPTALPPGLHAMQRAREAKVRELRKGRKREGRGTAPSGGDESQAYRFGVPTGAEARARAREEVAARARGPKPVDPATAMMLQAMNRPGAVSVPVDAAALLHNQMLSPGSLKDMKGALAASEAQLRHVGKEVRRRKSVVAGSSVAVVPPRAPGVDPLTGRSNATAAPPALPGMDPELHLGVPVVRDTAGGLVITPARAGGDLSARRSARGGYQPTQSGRMPHKTSPAAASAVRVGAAALSARSGAGFSVARSHVPFSPITHQSDSSGSGSPTRARVAPSPRQTFRLPKPSRFQGRSNAVAGGGGHAPLSNAGAPVPVVYRRLNSRRRK